MKIIKYILLIIMTLSFSSCKSNNIELPFKVGDVMVKEEYNIYDNYKKIMGHTFFEYEGYNVVISGIKTIERVEFYRKKTPTDFSLRNVKYGIDVFEAVEKYGIPKEQGNCRLFCLIYETNKESKYALYFGKDLANEKFMLIYNERI